MLNSTALNNSAAFTHAVQAATAAAADWCWIPPAFKTPARQCPMRSNEGQCCRAEMRGRILCFSLQRPHQTFPISISKFSNTTRYATRHDIRFVFCFSKKHIAWFCHWTCTEGHRALTPFECYHDARFSQDFLCLKTLAEVVKVGSPILKPGGWGCFREMVLHTLATCVTCVTCVNVMSLPHCSPRLHKFLWGVSLPDIRRLCKNFARLRSCIVFKPQSLGYFEMWDLSREQGNSTPKRRLKTRW